MHFNSVKMSSKYLYGCVGSAISSIAYLMFNKCAGSVWLRPRPVSPPSPSIPSLGSAAAAALLKREERGVLTTFDELLGLLVELFPPVPNDEFI